MLKEKTVFVLGAGASMSYLFPSGHELFKRILMLCQHAGSEPFNAQLSNAGCNISLALELAQKIKDTDFRSIDALLGKYDRFRDIGKTLIAYELLPHETVERFSLLTQDTNWMLTLFEKMETDTLEDFKRNLVTFITFNYDRSLEFFFQRDLTNRYHAKPQEIAEVMKAIPIIHVHGSFGNLTEMPYGGHDAVGQPYLRGQDIQSAGKSITILHEAQEDSDDFKLARQALSDAKRIAFVGFGYHPINMKRLRLLECVGHVAVYATRLGITDPELIAFRQQNCRAGIVLVNGDGVDLLRNTELLY